MSTDELLAALRVALAGHSEVRFALLFGSAATRGPDQARDIDVALSLSRPFRLLELAALADALEQAIGREVDLVDLEDASTLLRGEVLKYGLVVDARDRAALTDFQVRVPVELEDLRPHFERESQGLARILEKEAWSASTSSATKSAG